MTRENDDSDAETGSKPARRIQSIEVGFRLIRVLEKANGPMQLKQLAAAAGMPPSKAYLYLVSFAREGLVRQDDATGHYGLGAFAMQLGLSAVRQSDVITQVRPELLDLSERTGYAAYVSVWTNRGPGIAVKVDGAHQGSLAVRLGFVLPALRSATGLVFLVHLPERETRAVVEAELAAEMAGQDAAATAARRAEVARLVEETRRNGYAMTGVTRSYINAGFMAISAPVFDYSGGMVAAITILGPRELMDEAKRRDAAGLVLAAAGRLSARLGHRGAAAATP
ncbi:MAG: IclR family transcriptional regulator [Thalassobaculales bacterium]